MKATANPPQRAEAGTAPQAGRFGVDHTRAPRHRLLVWVLWLLWGALSLAGLWLNAIGSGNEIFGIAAVGYATVGAFVAARHPRNAVGWLMLTFAVMVALQGAGQSYARTTEYPAYLAVAWLTQLVLYPLLATILVFFPLLFPDGQLRSRPQRFAMLLGIAAVVAGVVGIALKPDKMDVHASAWNPLGLPGVAGEVFWVVEGVGQGMLVLASILAAVSFAARFRRSCGVERQQLKWFAFAALLLVLGLAAFGVGGGVTIFMFTYGDVSAEWAIPTMNVGLAVSFLTAVMGIPLAIGIAMLRHHLYDIDLVINRTLVYATLTTALTAVYVGSVLVLERILSPVTGGMELAVAGSTLIAAALFRPARRRVQNAVDQRFYRRRYDAARTLDNFAARLCHELDLDAVGADLCAAVDETVQPAHASLWLRP